MPPGSISRRRSLIHAPDARRGASIPAKPRSFEALKDQSHVRKEKKMGEARLTRRAVLRTAALTTAALAMPFVRGPRADAAVVLKGKIVLAWHANIAARWLDPQQHDGTASGDNFLMALNDALIKNFR